MKKNYFIKLSLQFTREVALGLYNLMMNESIIHCGKMDEGHSRTLLGLKGIPELTEKMGITKSLYSARYTKHPVHFIGISLTSSFNILKSAKERGAILFC